MFHDDLKRTLTAWLKERTDTIHCPVDVSHPISTAIVSPKAFRTIRSNELLAMRAKQVFRWCQRDRHGHKNTHGVPDSEIEPVSHQRALWYLERFLFFYEKKIWNKIQCSRVVDISMGGRRNENRIGCCRRRLDWSFSGTLSTLAFNFRWTKGRATCELSQ